MLLVLLVDRWVWRLAGIRSTSRSKPSGRCDSVQAVIAARSCDLRRSHLTKTLQVGGAIVCGILGGGFFGVETRSVLSGAGSGAALLGPLAWRS
jgi:hypothetical protein